MVVKYKLMTGIGSLALALFLFLAHRSSILASSPGPHRLKHLLRLVPINGPKNPGPVPDGSNHSPSPVPNGSNPVPNERLELWSSNYNYELVKQSLRKKGHSLSDLAPWSTLWTDKVHLCIMFNLNGVEPSQSVTDLLVAYYYPFFRNITFIFDGHRNKPDYVPDFIDFISCESHVGRHQHKCIRSCIHRGDEDTKGYLYISDDMFINISKMANFPPEKVWFIGFGLKDYSWIVSPNARGWAWGPPWFDAKHLKKVIENFPSEWIELLKRNAGFPNQFKIMSTSDIIYLPKSLTPNMTLVLDQIIQTTDLFCEIATRLALDVLTDDTGIVYFSDGYLWTDKSIAAIRNIAETGHFVHPIKLGIKEHRDIWIEYMEKQLLYSTSVRTIN